MSSIRKLVRISILVLIFIFICNFTSFYFNKTLATKEDKVQETERSIRDQSRLTQQVVGDLLKWKNAEENKADHKHQLETSFKAFQDNHNFLLKLAGELEDLKFIEAGSIKKELLKISQPQQELVVQIVNLIKQNDHPLQNSLNRIYQSELFYCKGLEKILTETEAISASVKQNFVKINFTYSACLIIGLVCLGVFVMIPMFRSGIKNFVKLQKTFEEVYRSETLLRSILDSSPDFIFVKNPDHRFVMVNKAMADSLNLNPEDFIGKTDLEMGYDELEVKGEAQKGIKGYWADDDQVMATGETLFIEEEPNSAPGKPTQYINTTKIALSDKDGNRWGLLGFGHNITNVKQKDLLLQAVSKATHQLISNNNLEEAIGESVKLLGKQLYVDTIYVYKNTEEEGTEFLYTSELVQWQASNDTLQFNNPEAQNFQLHLIPDVVKELKGNKIYTSATRNLSDERLRIWLEAKTICSIAMIPLMQEGKLWGLVSFLHKDFEKKWTETELSILQSFSSTLGEAIKRQNTEKQLILAKEEAEAGSKAKSAFMANMSHELRTPMNGIIGFTDLILTTELEHSQREYLQNVSKSAYSLLNIINDILDFSKIEAGKLIIDPVEFSLKEVIEETAQILSIKALEKGIEFVCMIDPALPSQLLGDAARIKQILLNLMGNAIKFTSVGEVVIEVYATQSVQKLEGRSVTEIAIAVRDTGIGIPLDKLTKVFESFTQADSSTTRKYGGTGLGLTISKGLAELMGGTITAASELNKGSCFTLVLPFEVLHQRPLITSAKRPHLRRVLVVDDNATNCKLMKRIFEYLEVPCELSSSGEEALELIKSKKGDCFDLIITDHQMPNMDGVTLVQEIKNFSNCQETFILMLSSLDKTMLEKEAQHLGIDKFLTKPVKMHELDMLLSEIYQKEGSVSKTIAKPKLHQFGENFTAMVVEDQKINMILITEVLRKMNIDVIAAYNGKQAIEALDEHEPDVIFMDINMPVMDGYTATRLIRELPHKKSKTPIIALTADAMIEDREKCMNAGMNDFVSKPFRLEEIKIVLEKHLRN